MGKGGEGGEAALTRSDIPFCFVSFLEALIPVVGLESNVFSRIDQDFCTGQTQKLMQVVQVVQQSSMTRHLGIWIQLELIRFDMLKSGTR